MKSGLEAAAEEWIKLHPETITLYLELVRRARAAGMPKIGIGFLTERVRWEHRVVRRDDDSFKINNNHRAYIARHLIKLDPSLEGFFEFRSVGYRW